MYTLKINDDNTVETTIIETLMERSNYVDNIQILVEKMYKGQIDMSDTTLWMKYHMPITDKIKMIQLDAVNTNYKENYIQYKIPVEAYLTAEAGNIDVSFTFIKLVADENGEYTSYIRRTGSGIIRITPLAQFDKYEPSEMFDEIDQRLLVLEARQKDLAALSQAAYDEMARDVRLDKENRKVTLTNINGDMGEGIQVYDLSETIAEDLTGVDPDKVQDGVIHLDELDNMINLDKLLE